MTPISLQVHASFVAFAGRGVLILGASGAGKSVLALQLIALGADLVADDQTQLSLQAGRLIGTAPLALAGLIEARGIGILRIGFLPGAPVHLVVDMDQRETSRLPTPRTIEFLGIACDLVFGSQSNHFPGALMCYLRGERHA